MWFRSCVARSYSMRKVVTYVMSPLIGSTLWYVWYETYCQISNISHTKSQNLNDSHLVLQLYLLNLLKPGVGVENEDVVGAAPIGDAPTTSEWPTTLLPAKVCLILEVSYMRIFTRAHSTKNQFNRFFNSLLQIITQIITIFGIRFYSTSIIACENFWWFERLKYSFLVIYIVLEYSSNIKQTIKTDPQIYCTDQNCERNIQ